MGKSSKVLFGVLLCVIVLLLGANIFANFVLLDNFNLDISSSKVLESYINYDSNDSPFNEYVNTEKTEHSLNSYFKNVYLNSNATRKFLDLKNVKINFSGGSKIDVVTTFKVKLSGKLLFFFTNEVTAKSTVKVNGHFIQNTCTINNVKEVSSLYKNDRVELTGSYNNKTFALKGTIVELVNDSSIRIEFDNLAVDYSKVTFNSSTIKKI